MSLSMHLKTVHFYLELQKIGDTPQLLVSPERSENVPLQI
jgi:hypothetical protein